MIDAGIANIFGDAKIGPAMSMGYYVESPPSNYTSYFDNDAFSSGAFDGLGYCGSATFKHKSMFDLVDVNGLTWENVFWNDGLGERPRVRDPILFPTANEYFMFDGVLKKGNTPDQQHAIFSPFTIARTKANAPGPKQGFNRIAFTSEYMSFDTLWFDIDYDDNILFESQGVGKWLTIVWSHLPVTSFANWRPDAKYGTASGAYGIRAMLYEARTGVLLGKTDKQISGATLAFTDWSTNAPTYVFDGNINNNAPGLDFEINNNCGDISGEMLRMSSVWWSVGSDCWDPLVIGKQAVGTNLPSILGGKRAVINVTVTEQDGSHVYGHRPGAICGVTTPDNTNNIGALAAYNASKAPSTESP